MTKEKPGEYFQRVRDALGLTKLSEDETFKICVNNELTSEPKYTSYRKESGLNLHSNPWDMTKEKPGEYFQRVRDALGIDDSSK